MKKKNLTDLFEKYTQEKCDHIIQLPPSGSYREYFRLSNSSRTLIGVFNEDFKENLAFVSFTRCFNKHNVNVPQIIADDLSNNIYLQTDLGDTTLFRYITEDRAGSELGKSSISLYKKVITELPKFQIVAGKDIDYNVCYPRKSFDKQSMMWDLSYFKYYFLKLAKIPFDEQLLENDYNTLTDYLLETDCNHFLYRDFQSRNIMIKDDVPYFIDYQGGRKGAIQYDLASLLYDAKANIPQQTRNDLLDFYLKELKNYIDFSEEEFRHFYYGYVYIRIMQAMGAYGFRGFYEKKTHFLQSIPYALKNLRWLINNVQLPVEIPALMNVLDQIVNAKSLEKYASQKSTDKNNLTVRITSFAYKNGVPEDKSGHGCGFVFDCRALPNPGRYEKYKKLSGLDQQVIDFLKEDSEIYDFQEHAFAIIDASVNKYITRGFTNLNVNFGCTGGQHRSVFNAEALKNYLKEKFDINIEITHREKESWGNYY